MRGRSSSDNAVNQLNQFNDNFIIREGNSVVVNESAPILVAAASFFSSFWNFWEWLSTKINIMSSIKKKTVSIRKNVKKKNIIKLKMVSRVVVPNEELVIISKCYGVFSVKDFNETNWNWSIRTNHIYLRPNFDK